MIRLGCRLHLHLLLLMMEEEKGIIKFNDEGEEGELCGE